MEIKKHFRLALIAFRTLALAYLGNYNWFICDILRVSCIRFVC